MTKFFCEHACGAGDIFHPTGNFEHMYPNISSIEKGKNISDFFF